MPGPVRSFPMTDTPDLSALLTRAGQGDARAAEDLFPLVYEQLRADAAQRMARERPDHTLQPTALVHEAYLRLAGPNAAAASTAWDGRGHFYAAAAEAMRRILIEHARARNRVKRGGEWRRVTLDSLDLAAESVAVEEIVSVDAAIRRMEERDPRMARIVRLRFFAGLEVQEVAEVLGVSDRTVRREWAVARAWLFRALAAEDESGRGADATETRNP